MSILGQPTVAHLAKPEQTFHAPEKVLDTCSHSGFVSVFVPFFIGEFAVPASRALREVTRAGGTLGNDLLLSGISRVTIDSRFITVQQVFQNHRIVHIRPGRRYRVDQFAATVDADVSLHSEVPLIAFAGLVHLRIALLFATLGLARGVHNAGIDNRSAAHSHAIVLQVLVHDVEKLIAQIMALHQMAKLSYRGLIRNRLVAQINTNKATHCARIIQRFLGGRIRKTEPVLESVNAQHPLNANRSASGAFRFGIKWLNHLYELFPRDDAFHVLKKLLFAGLLSVFLKAVGKGLLSRSHQTCVKRWKLVCT